MGEAQTSVIVNVAAVTGAVLTCPVTVAYETLVGTAAEGPDFVRTAGVVRFPAGTVNGATQSITVPLTPDVIDEPDETFVIRLAPVTGAVVGTTSQTTITIVDNDPTPTLSLADVTVQEGIPSVDTQNRQLIDTSKPAIN